MSSEQIKPKSIVSKTASLMAFPVGISAIGGIKSVVRNQGVKNAIKSVNTEGFKALNNALKTQNADVFSRGLILSNNYDQYSRLAKDAAKLQKLVNKNKIPFKEKIFNIFRKNKVTVDTVKEELNTANTAVNSAKATLASGEQIAATAKETIKNGFGQNVGSLFKKGIKDPFIWVLTALETIPEFINKVIPTFKEKGIVAGMKETGKLALKTAGNVGTYVASSAIGRVIGMAVGSVIPGVGTAVCGNIGSMVAVSLGNIIKDKIFKPKAEDSNPQQTQPVNEAKKIYA